MSNNTWNDFVEFFSRKFNRPGAGFIIGVVIIVGSIISSSLIILWIKRVEKDKRHIRKSCRPESHKKRRRIMNKRQKREDEGGDSIEIQNLSPHQQSPVTSFIPKAETLETLCPSLSGSAANLEVDDDQNNQQEGSKLLPEPQVCEENTEQGSSSGFRPSTAPLLGQIGKKVEEPRPGGSVRLAKGQGKATFIKVATAVMSTVRFQNANKEKESKQ
jgi:hypothetical protein